MQQNGLHKKFGLFTAIAMVIGIVVGSGVFFKAEKVLDATGGNLLIGVFAWIIGGLIMIICAYTFALMATKHEYVNGVVDYAEVTLNKNYAYYLGWFMATIYLPSLTSVLAWVSARYTCVLFGFEIAGGEAFSIACFYLISSYALNSLSPVLAGKFQVSTTIIKLIPLVLMAIVGTVMGFSSGMIEQNFTTIINEVDTSTALFTAIVATAFAYDGWIIATSINAELKNAKKNLPRALVIGTFVIMLVYILYYIGLAGVVSNATLMASGEAGAHLAFTNAFSKFGGTLLFVFIVISCLGTLNGLMLGCTRAVYSLAARGRGPNPELFKQIDKVTNMPTNSAILGLFFSGMWLLYFYGANLSNWFAGRGFDSSEIAIVSLYAMYIPIFISFMRKEKNMNPFNRTVMPILSVLSCIFMIIAAVFSHKMAIVWYLIVFVIFMLTGWFVDRKNPRS